MSSIQNICNFILDSWIENYELISTLIVLDLHIRCVKFKIPKYHPSVKVFKLFLKYRSI